MLMPKWPMLGQLVPDPYMSNSYFFFEIQVKADLLWKFFIPIFPKYVHIASSQVLGRDEVSKEDKGVRHSKKCINVELFLRPVFSESSSVGEIFPGFFVCKASSCPHSFLHPSSMTPLFYTDLSLSFLLMPLFYKTPGFLHLFKKRFLLNECSLNCQYLKHSRLLYLS